MEILNFMEECEKPAPTLCFDIMELVGEQVNIIREKKYKQDHMDEWCGVCCDIENVGDAIDDMTVDDIDDGVMSDQFFCELYHQEALTNTVSLYRRNK